MSVLLPKCKDFLGLNFNNHQFVIIIVEIKSYYEVLDVFSAYLADKLVFFNT